MLKKAAMWSIYGAATAAWVTCAPIVVTGVLVAYLTNPRYRRKT